MKKDEPTVPPPSVPGWYNDPEGKSSHQAYWDGSRWTGETRPGRREAPSRRAIGIVLLAIATLTLLAVFGSVSEEDSAGDLVLGSLVLVLSLGLPGFYLTFPKAWRRTPWAGLVVGLAGIGVIVGGLLAYQSDDAFDSSAIETNAVLVADPVERCSDNETVCSWAAPVEYMVADNQITTTVNTPADMRRGDTIVIRYSPTDPSTARTDAPQYAAGSIAVPTGDWVYWLLPVLGALILGLGVALAVARLRADNRT